MWESPITGVVSGQKTGKTRVAADIALAWVETHSHGLVRLAATVAEQIKKELWEEIRQLYRRAPRDLHLPEPALDPATGMRWPDGRAIHAITAKSIDSIAGHSGAEQLWIVDEAFGFPDALWQVILGNMMGGGSLLWLSNPTGTVGRAYDWTTRGGCSIVHIDSRENPNFHGENIPGLATPEGVQQIIDTYGEDSPEFDVRVRGIPPRQGSNVLVQLADVEQAIARHASSFPDLTKQLVLGVDVARFGDDDSVIQPRRAYHAFEAKKFHNISLTELARKIIEEADRLRQSQACTVCVEEDGIGGGCIDPLRDSRPSWMTIIPVTVGGDAKQKDRYSNRRSELWTQVSAWIKAGGAIPKNDALKRELIAPTYDFDLKLRRRVQSKKEIKKKLGNSPDQADALVVSMACEVESVERYEPAPVGELSRWADYEGEYGFG